MSTSLTNTDGETRSDATQGVFGYMALYADFGEREHIFSPVSVWNYLWVPDCSDVGMHAMGEHS